MTHIHRRFTDEQVKNLFRTYEEGHMDRSQVDITRLRPSIALDRPTDRLQMGKNPLFFNQLGTDKEPRVVVLGQDYI
jgi:hypothetical protein